MEEGHSEKVVIGKRKACLSEENLLEENVTNLETWPFLPRGVISPDRKELSQERQDRIHLERDREFSMIENCAERAYNRHAIVISFSLAIAAGVLGNLAVSLLFGPLNLRIPWSSIGLIGVILLGIMILVYLIIQYLPTGLSYTVRFIPPWEYPSFPLPPLQKDKLEPNASVIALFDSPFIETIVKFTNLISVAILRDTLKTMQWNTVRITKLTRMHGGVPFYTLTFDFQKKWLFLKPQILDKVKEELFNISLLLVNAKIFIGVHAIDIDQDRWLQRGHLFLNTVTLWNLDAILREVENQIEGLG